MPDTGAINGRVFLQRSTNEDLSEVSLGELEARLKTITKEAGFLGSTSTPEWKSELKKHINIKMDELREKEGWGPNYPWPNYPDP